MCSRMLSRQATIGCSTAFPGPWTRSVIAPASEVYASSGRRARNVAIFREGREGRLRLARPPCPNGGCCPAPAWSVSQAKVLDGETDVNMVLQLDVPDAEICERIQHRSADPLARRAAGGVRVVLAQFCHPFVPQSMGGVFWTCPSVRVGGSTSAAAGCTTASSTRRRRRASMTRPASP